MSELTVTARDIQLARQNRQVRYCKLLILNREWGAIGTIFGQLESGSINIDSTSNMRRTATILLKHLNVSYNILANLSVNYYIKLYLGIEDNSTSEVVWYNQGSFIINQNGIKIDTSSGTLELSLTDLMFDLTGDRCGILHAYTALVKNEQNIDDVMKNVLQIAGVTRYSLEPIRSYPEQEYNYSTDETEYTIPYDMKFESGVSAYDILDKCVNLYPYFEMYFDVDGTFVCRKAIPDKFDSSMSIISAENMAAFTVSEDTTIEWSKVKNFVEVWGKDGNYYGEAQDENVESPFNVGATRIMRKVINGADSETGVDSKNIYDRYDDATQYYADLKDKEEIEENIAVLEKIKPSKRTEEEKQLLNSQKTKLASIKMKVSSHIKEKGDDLAKQWAEEVLSKVCRTYDTVNVSTILLPFFNDVGFKLSYRSKRDNLILPYTVQSLSHNLGDNTTTLTLRRFYNGQCYALYEKLSTPQIVNCSANNMTLTVEISPVQFATQYVVCIDDKAEIKSTGTTIVHTFESWYEGTHTVTVFATAEGYKDSSRSAEYTVTFSPDAPVTEADIIVTSDGNRITTDDGNHIKISKG